MAQDDVPVRVILTPKVGDDGLFVQPKDFSPERETVEQHNRDAFAAHYKYADPFTGLTRTYDDKGDYNCGRCNQADGNKCLLVKTKIDREAGSCGDWENLCAGDAEFKRQFKSPEVAVYGVAKNGKGFGCHRCPFASKAFKPDSRERDLYCGKGDFRAFADACCVLNGAPVVGDKVAQDSNRWDLLVKALAAKPRAMDSKRGWIALAQDWAMPGEKDDEHDKPAQDANDCWASMAKDWAKAAK